MKPPSWPVIAVSGSLALLALGLFRFGLIPWQRFTDAKEIVVAVAEVKPESRPVVLRMSGELQPSAEVDVVSRLAGRLTEVRFKTGETVTAGAVVASVSSGEIVERTRLVESGLIATRKQFQERQQEAAEADKQLSRHQELYRRDLIARRDVEQAEIQAATATAQLELARAQIAQEEAMLLQARKLQQLAHIVAPVSGLVVGALSPGAPVTAARAILAIAQIDRLKLVGAAPARFKDLIGDGMTAQVSPRELPAGARAGKVVRLDRQRRRRGDSARNQRRQSRSRPAHRYRRRCCSNSGASRAGIVDSPVGAAIAGRPVFCLFNNRRSCRAARGETRRRERRPSGDSRRLECRR